MTEDPEKLVVIGVPFVGLAALPDTERSAIEAARTVAGGRRHLAGLADLGLGGHGAGVGQQPETIEITADIDLAIDGIARALASGGRVVVLASGDPGFFGLGRALAARFGPGRLDVRPALSSVAASFARLGLPWDDAVVVSAHGRSLESAVTAVCAAEKAAVLTSPENDPATIGKALLAAGARFGGVAVVSDIGLPTEAVATGPDLEWLAGTEFSPLSVLLLLPDDLRSSATLSWSPEGSGTTLRGASRSAGASAEFGLPESEFERRDGMITKAEARSVVLSRLALPADGVLWDVGAGSGSVSVEAARLSPGLEVFAIERSAEACELIAANAKRHGAQVRVVLGDAPGILAGLPSPDRAFVGGGGLQVLDAVLARLRPVGRLVATYAAADRAFAAAERLGNLVQLSVARSDRLPDGGLRLKALDPVFICWGPA